MPRDTHKIERIVREDPKAIEDTIEEDQYQEVRRFSHMRDPYILRGVALVLGLIALIPMLGTIFSDKDMGNYTNLSSVAIGAFAAMLTGNASSGKKGD